MINSPPINLIVAKLADESRRSRNSAVVWFLIGAVVQAGIVALFYTAQSFNGASAGEKIKFFFIVSPFVAWLPLAASVYYFRRSRRLKMSGGNFLYRALSGEPQLVAQIEREPDAVEPEPIAKPTAEEIKNERSAEIAGSVFEVVLDVALSAIFNADSRSPNDDYNSSSSATGANSRELPPRVFIRLTNGERCKIVSPLAAAETVAALRAHAPHASVVEIAR